MTQHDFPSYAPGLADAGGQVAQLREVLALVEEIAGASARSPGDGAIEEAARISGAYAAAEPVCQRRFDDLAGQSARWAAGGVETLLILREANRPCAPAAAVLARALRKALAELSRVVGV